MNSKPRFAIAAALLMLLPLVSLRAQPAPTGSIQCRVYNPAAKEYVGNAEVRLEGTKQRFLRSIEQYGANWNSGIKGSF